MLLSALRHNKRRRAVEPDSLPRELLVDEAERIAAVIAGARKQLQPFASMTAKKDIFKMHRYLGAFDGVGSLLHLARLDPSTFQTEAPCLIEKLESQALNYTVVFSLLVTIAISLSVIHAGGGPYQTMPEEQARLFSSGSDIDSLAWTDAATFIAYRTSPSADVARQIHLMRAVFYAIENILLALAVSCTILGLFKSVAFTLAFSTALPTLTSRCENLLEHHRRLYPVYIMMNQGGIATIMYSVVFIVARSSAIAFFAQATVLAVAHIPIFNDQWGAGYLASLIWQQHREARRLFAAPNARKPEAREPSDMNEVEVHDVPS